MNHLLFPGTHRAFSLLQSLPSSAWRNELRPTVLGLVMTPDSRLLLVLPKKANPHGWIPPQGPIERNQSPLDALLRDMHQELGYTADAFNMAQARALQKFSGDEKTYYVVGLPLWSWQKPQLNGENRDFITVGGPGELAEKITECSTQKQKLIVSSVLVAIQLSLLHSERWNRRGLMLRMYANREPK
ncbi:NUDIX hydrolase [Candidatus Kaiserbacteria bacterium]|nr:NUDIX hydrolase [Candidatus Kaiserbacteria bacterium]